VAIRRAEGARIGRRVFMDIRARTRDGQMVTIGDDPGVSFGADVIGHDMSPGNVLTRQPVTVAAACRIGECARVGAGAEAARYVPPMTSTVTGERL